MNTYITAQSWNGTWFYYNSTQDTWVMSDSAELTKDFDCSEADMIAAKQCAHRENFAAINISLDPEVEAN